MERITTAIGEANAHQSSIAAMVEEQAATTTEIERNLITAAQSTRQIAEHVDGVVELMRRGRTQADELREVVGRMDAVSAELLAGVEQFDLGKG